VHCQSTGNGCAHCCGDEPPPKAKAKPTDDEDDDCCGNHPPPKAKAKPADDIDDDCCGNDPPPKAKADRDDDFHKEPAPEAKVKPADDRDGDSGIGGWLNDWDQDNPAPNANLPDHGFSLGGRAATATDGRGSWGQYWDYGDYETSKGKKGDKGSSKGKDEDRGKYYDYADYYEKKLQDQETRISNLEDGMDKMDRRTRTLKEKLEAAERELQWWREQSY